MEKTKKKKRKVIVIVVIVLVLALLVGGFVACSRAISASIEQLSSGFTELSTVEKRDISNYISVSGSVESENMVKVSSTLTARVKTLYVEIGSEVKEGDILLEFDSSDLQQQYDTLKKAADNAEGLSDYNHSINERNLENAKSDKEITLQQAQRGIDEATNARNNAYARETTLQNQVNSAAATRDDLRNRMNALPAAPSVPEEATPEEQAELLAQAQAIEQERASLLAQYQEAELNVQSAQAQLDALREQLSSFDSAVQSAKDAYAAAERSANAMIQSYQDVLDMEQYSNSSDSQTELDKLADMISDCIVRAPRSGIVTSLNVAEGSFPTAEALLTIENKDALKITVSIAEADILKIEEGMPAVVKTTATGEQEFAATVTRVVNIYKSGEMSLYGQSSEGGYSAEITIDDEASDLLIGMNAKVQIILAEKKDVLSVPYEAIGEDEDGSYVLLAVTDAANGLTTAKKARIEPGMSGTYYVEITSDEVKEGDKIVMSAGSYADGDVLLVMPNLNELQGTEADADE